MLEYLEKENIEGIKVYDPYISNDIVVNQYHNLDTFVNDVDIVVIMVNHNEIKENMDKLARKVVFDTKNICDLDKTYKM